MPNFDNNLNSPLFNNTSSDNGFNHPIIPTFRSPDVNPSFFNLRMPNINSGSEEQSANPNGESPLFKNKVIPTRMLPINTAAELYENRRYPGYSKDIIDIEDSFANKQSTLNKAFNGIAKGGLLAGTTIAGSGGMLYGTVKSLFTGRMADIWDNEIMRGLDEINTEVDQNYLPNYYTNLEKNSAWYSPNYWFTANFLFDTLIKNSGFAVGAMVSGNIANGILGGLGKAAGGLALRSALAAESSQAFRLFSPILRNSARAFSVGKNMEVASTLENGLSSMADITSASGKLSNLLKSSNFYTKLNDVGRRGAVALYSSAGESSFEALQTMNEFRNTLIEDYKQKNGGLEPQGEELDKINLEAEKVGKVSFLGNMALLGVTEYAQLPYLMGSSYKNSKKIANSLLGKTDDVILSDAKYAVKTPKTSFGKLYSSATNIGKYIFDPKESAQEISQFALQVGTQNYFRKAYQGDEVSLLQDGLIYGLYGEDESGEGVGALNTKEGIIGGITGGITGGLMQAAGNFKESKQKKINTSNFINKLNNAPTFKEAFKYKSEAAQRGIILQDQYNDAVISGDKLEALDLKQDALVNYLSPRIKYGRFDMVVNDLAEFRAQGQTEEGLASLKEQGYVNVEDNITSFQERVSQIEEVAKKLNNIYETLNVRYSGIIDKEGNKKYSEYVIDKLAYASYKINNYESRIPQLNSSLLSKGVDISSVLETVNSNTKFNSEVVEQIIDDVNNRNITTSEKDEIKTEIRDVIELGLRKQKFIDDFNNIVNGPEKYDDFYNTDYIEQIEITDVNNLNDEKIKLSVGEEYPIDSPIYVKNGKLVYNPKIKILSSALDKELEVEMPNGETLFISKDKLEKLKINPDKKENSRDKDILVSAIKKVLSEDENVKGLSSDELINYVNVLNDSKITFAINKEFNNLYEDIRKQEEEKRKKQEQLLKTKDVVSKEQEELESASGTTETINEDQAGYTEGKLKEASILFKSSVTESEDWDNVEQSAPHIKRARIFLNNVARFKNRKNYKVILITPTNAKNAGLEGIVQLSYKKSLDTPLSEIEDVTNPENGFMAQVFVYTDKSGSYFVNEKGEKIGKVGKQLENIESSGIVFQTMPAATLYNSKGTPRFRKNEEQKANRELAAYKIFREQKFANDAIGQAYPFKVSRGIRRKTEIKEDNHISSILGKDGDKIISSISSLLEVVTTGKISFNGELISFPKGTVVFKYGDTLDFANNKPLTEKQASSVYAVIEKLADNVLNGKSIQGAYSNFLQNILYWKSKAETTSPSQIRIDVNTMSLHLGKESFPISEISQRKDEIINALKQAFITVNDKTLKEGVNKTFIEYALNAQGELKPIVWKNYQEYLLSDKYPNGDKRDVSETPLITHAPKPTELFPSSYVQRYSTIEEGTLEFPYELIKEEPAPVKQETPTETKKEQPKQQNKYNLTPGTVNGYKLSDGRDILFTGEMTPEGPNITIQQTSVFNDIVADKATINGIRLTIEKIGFDTSKMSDTQALDFYLKLLIVKDIENQNEQQQTTQPEQTQETAQGQTTETNLQPEQGAIATEQSVSPNVDNNTSEEKPSSENPPVDFSKLKTKGKGKGLQFRKLGISDSERMTEEDIKEFKKWHAENVPNIPFEILEQMIVINSTESAWGVFEDGVAKFVRGGLKGTEYHEVFEAIWANLLTETEKKNLLEEFRNKKGTFIDRQSGEEYNYNSPSVDDNMIKERIADDFADYRLGKIKNNSIKGMIKEFFNRIMNFFKSFIAKKSLKEKLFDEINKGKFKNKKIVSENIAPQYRVVEGLSEEVVNEVVDDMIGTIASFIFGNNNYRKELLFNPEQISGKGIFQELRQKHIETGIIESIGENRWNQIKERAIDKLRTLGVSFEEDVDINDENASQKEYEREAFVVDWKKTSSAAIRFSLATIPQRVQMNQQYSDELVFPNDENGGFVVSDNIGGFIMSDFSRVFATLMDKLSNTNSPEEFVRKLVELAETDTTYLSVFARLGGNLSTKSIDFANMTNQYDIKYFTQFYNLFSKQKPETLIQYINDGEVYSNNANLFSAVTEITNSWINNIKALSKSEDSLISYDKNQKIYKIDSEKIKSFPIRKANDRINLLNAIGINFDLQTYNLLSDEPETIGKRRISQKEQFDTAVDKISEYLGSTPDIMTVKGNTLGISGPLRTLSRLYVIATNPNQDSTFFGVNNQRKGSYAENNAASFFENDFNESETIDELLEKRPELNGYFSKGSQILKKGGLFFDEDGNRIAKLKLLTIEGLKNIEEGKNKGISKLTLSERVTQEINQNINGNYYVLVPGDGSTEWMMNLGNIISFEEVEAGVYSKKLEEIFIDGYLMDEVNLALFGKNKTVTVKKKSKELRFMKDILSDKQVKEIEDLLSKDTTTLEQVEKYIKDNKKELVNSVEQFVKNVNEESFKNLTNSSQIEQIGENEFLLNKFDSEFIKEKGLSTASRERVDNFINFLNLNYIINNIEYHKFIFGDPYQYKVKGDGSLDETKRIKMYLSPRRRLFDLQEFNDIFNIDYNKVGDIELDKKDPTYHTFKSYTKTATLSDVEVNGSVSRGDFPEKIRKQYEEIDETDAMSWIEDNTYREVNIKKGQWSDEAEKWHQWQMAFTRQNYPNYKYTNDELKKHDEELVNTPEPEYHIEQIKPIVSGNKYGSKEINPVGDKLSQMAIYYSMVKGTNLEKLYIKMKKEDLGYVIVQTGRKFGSEGTNPMYVNGKFNEEEYTNTIDVAWDTYGIIVETATEGDKKQTRGSQIPKVITMDMFSNGEVSEGYNKEEIIAANKEFNSAEEDLAKFRYEELLDRLGIIEEDGEFISTSNKTIAETLQEELLRRDASENVKDSLKLNEDEEFEIPFEASPSYEQIRSILYSMVNKSFISPKMNGAPHVQAPSTMFEQENRILAIKENGVYRLIVTQKQYNSLSAADKKNAIITPDTEKYFNELGEEQKKTAVLTDNTLKFYTKEQPWCEIMLPNWFKNKLKKGKLKNASDEDIINYLNNSKEGQRILSGMAFRIPTQALSSIERFKVKSFLPQYMGHTVIVPTEITKKSGSDFDIDKLNIYLKSIYIDNSGNPRIIEYKGSEEETKQFYAEVFEKGFDKKISNKSELLEAIDIVLYNLDDPKDLVSKHGDYIMSFRDKFASPMDVRDYLENQLNKMTEEEYYNNRKEDYVNRMYKSALENRYYEALERLFELQPIEKILSPVDDGGLEDVSKNLDKLRNDNESAIKGRLLNRNYMSNLRHAFIVGKAWVGIAAVNITGLSLRQKSKVYLDPNRISLLGKREQDFVKNLDITLPHNTMVLENGQKVVSLSGLKTADGTQYLSDRFSGYATAFVDIAANPFISKIIKSDIVISTFMLLEAIGTGNKGVYFLTQPIIEEYLKILDKEGTKSVINENNIKKVKELFPANEKDIKYVKISPEGLEQNIADYYKDGKLRPTKNAEQQKILDEFIKYKILADQLFEFTQATNYDTTRLTGVDSLYKKELLTKKVRERNIIANIDGVLNETFIGNLTNLLSKSTQAMGTIFKLDEPKIRAYVLDTVKRYATKPFMSNDDYERITNLIRSSFLDYIIQSHSTLNKEISDLLLNESTNVATQLELMKSKYPGISILQDFEVVSGNRENSAKTVKLKVNLKGDVFAENHYIAKMNELRDYNTELNEFYNNLIRVAILQGNSQSAISFKNIIPVQDYAKIITPIINNIVPGARLDNFTKSMFERNNFTNENVFVPAKIFYARESQYGDLWLPAFDFNKYKFNSDERQLLKLSEKFNFTQVSSDFVKVPRVFKTKVGIIDEFGDTDTQQRYIDILSGKVMRPEDWKQAKEKGDQSLNDVFYYKKVYTNEVDEFGERIPLKIWNSDEKVQAFEQVYKLMNVYGDSFRAAEYPSSNLSSIFDNGSIKTKELTDEEIVNAIKNPGKKNQIVTDSLKDEENSLSLPTEEDSWKEEDNNDTCTPF